MTAMLAPGRWRAPDRRCRLPSARSAAARRRESLSERSQCEHRGLEARLIAEALASSGGNPTHAARRVSGIFGTGLGIKFWGGWGCGTDQRPARVVIGGPSLAAQ